MASMADPIEDWCPQWAYGACRCESMCDDPAPASSAPRHRERAGMNYPKATCDPGTVALRLANERADRWKQRHDALAARMASVEALADKWQAEAQGRSSHAMHVLWDCGDDLRAVLGSDAHTEQTETG